MSISLCIYYLGYYTDLPRFVIAFVGRLACCCVRLGTLTDLFFDVLTTLRVPAVVILLDRIQPSLYEEECVDQREGESR